MASTVDEECILRVENGLAVLKGLCILEQTLVEAKVLRESMRESSKKTSALCKRVVEEIMQSKGIGNFTSKCTEASATVATCQFACLGRPLGLVLCAGPHVFVFLH